MPDAPDHADLESGGRVRPAPATTAGTRAHGIDSRRPDRFRNFRRDARRQRPRDVHVEPTDGTFRAVEVPDQEQIREVTIKSTSAVERQTALRLPGPDARLQLIPASFDLTAFDQMLRSSGLLQRWTEPPKLTIQTRVLTFTTTGAAESAAIDSAMTSAEADLLRGGPGLGSATAQCVDVHRLREPAEGDGYSRSERSPAACWRNRRRPIGWSAGGDRVLGVQPAGYRRRGNSHRRDHHARSRVRDVEQSVPPLAARTRARSCTSDTTM